MSDTSTRSGMLWEVERILTECKELGSLPQILLMENVIQVHSSTTDNSKGNVEDFNKWQLRLEELGYKNYWKDLIATDYGIPQTRNRCFMVSILGDYSYQFPPKQELKLRLKDMLEDKVDEKYYLSDKQIESLENGSYNASKPSVKLEITDKGLCQTLDTMSGGNRQPLVRVGNKSLQETLKQNEIDDTCYIDTYNKRIDKEKSGTITTGVSFRNNIFLADNDLRIRKLTPKECFRLQGVKDEDYEKVAKNQSNASLYHLAGDSIVVNVIQAIIKEML